MAVGRDRLRMITHLDSDDVAVDRLFEAMETAESAKIEPATGG